METIRLTVEPRQRQTKGEAGRMRRQGRVPGVFYGPGKQASALSVDAREFHFKIAGLEGSHLIELSSAAPELQNKIVILKEVQRHPLTSALVHIDLYEVDVNKPIQVVAPLHFVGKAEGVTAGGILQPLMREITVECLPREIPEFLEVDVSHLKIHDTIHISGVILPPGVKAVFDADESIVTVTPLAAAAPATPTEGETEATGAAAAAAPVEAEKQ
jgi:large subunit ribosomal protein L25